MTPPPTPELIRATVEQVARSAGFVGSEQLSRFLRYIVEETLAGRGRGLREQSIGVGAFGRPAEYDPTIDSAVRVQARQLRFKLAEYFAGEGRHSPIEITIPKGSYLPHFVARPGAPASASIPAAATEVSPVARRRLRKLGLMAGVVLVVTLTALWAARSSVAPPPPLRAVVVLPFLNLTGSPEQDYVSDGLTEEITTSLANVPGLAVVARTSAYQFKGQTPDVREIGKRLGVGAVIEGSVRGRGDSIRVTVQLARTSDGLHLWATTFDRRAKDLVAVEREIATDVAAAIRVRFALAAQPADPRQTTKDAEAYLLYLKGRHAWNRRTAESMARAIDLFKQAITRDSGFALAYAGLGAVYATQAVNNGAPPGVAPPLAIAAATRALALDSTLGEAHATLGLMRGFADWDFAASDLEFRRAIELSPNYPTARYWYANTLTARGKTDSALAELQRARELDPLSLPIGHAIAEALIYGRRWDDAIRQANSLLELDPSFSFAYNLLARAHAGAGRYRDAVEAASRAGDSLGAVLLGVREGAKPKRDGLRAIASMSPERQRAMPFILAICFAMIGEADSSFAWMDRAYAVHHPDLMSLLVEPALDPIRGDTRYRALLGKVGLADGSPE